MKNNKFFEYISGKIHPQPATKCKCMKEEEKWNEGGKAEIHKKLGAVKVFFNFFLYFMKLPFF